LEVWVTFRISASVFQDFQMVHLCKAMQRIVKCVTGYTDFTRSGKIISALKLRNYLTGSLTTSTSK